MSAVARQTRRQPQQAWAVGEQVKVGFLALTVAGKAPDGAWLLVNRDGTKRYAFIPHQGLQALGSFKEYCA